jgi:hypothetical protein
MRKGREGLAGVVREKMQRDPHLYGDAFIFYSKDLKKVKIVELLMNFIQVKSIIMHVISLKNR